MRKYRLVAKKGEGTFSEVLKAQNVKDGRYHAIKCMKNKFDTIDQVNNLREIQALRRLSPHEHIISLEEVLYDQPTGRLALVFELMDANLYELIRGRRHPLNPSLIKSYMWQLMKSLDHMHKKGIFHRDIKPENILIESTTDFGRGLKLADFGSCRGIYSKQPYTEYISTRWYRAPECLLTDGYYGPEMDLWGAGCVMFEITSLYPLFPGTNEVDQINRIHKILGTPPKEILDKLKAKGASHINFDFPPQKAVGFPQLLPNVASDCVDLITKLLKYDASERITAREAMRHPYFKDIRESEAKAQSEAKVQASTMPTGSGITAPQSLIQNQNIPAPNNIVKPLPNILNSNSVAEQQSQYTSKQNSVNNVDSQQYHLMQKNLQLQQAQQMQNMNKQQLPSAQNSTNNSVLPPINTSSLNSNQANKFPEPKSGRGLLPSNNTQKKKKKYRINYAQQQRTAQNSESVMKAYGVPKLFGNSTDGSKNGVSAAPSGNAPSANMGIGNINNVAGNNFGVGGTYNQFQTKPKKY